MLPAQSPSIRLRPQFLRRIRRVAPSTCRVGRDRSLFGSKGGMAWKRS